ncbi:hypothetical protein H2198_005821 [Neophaeococcomyces mojaviensis]|uniref:Uncharacterized protein n=1 Tax=Neophaeococcomyces mojaviensis TaxID=3383035 RepID=A0ACC3A4L1_9EURO|nr:hypothetical protein H2198_005821 [Knufia sp. JES_112]
MDDQQSSAPPARLAERLQRKNSNRRRSSAHSSRRSSISSLPSRASSVSRHGGPHSTHIAQHLRRASIIESRKARLAERAAHAEQVRLRAAAAKAATVASNTEERALAAEAARKKLLAELSARCGDHVQQAKAIAKEHRERQAARDAQMRDELAEKFADAARRRSNYQMNFRRPRTTSLAAVEETKIEPAQLRKMGQSAAAKIIQRAWRLSHARRVANEFAKTGVSVDNLKVMDFEDVTKLISTEDTMGASMRLAEYLGLLETENDENARRGAVRVFLSAFMVVAHPVQAFSHGGEHMQEQNLVILGRDLTESVQATIKAAVHMTTQPIKRELIQYQFHDFTSAFHAWKSQDLNVLADVMVGSFVNLDLIIQSTKDDTDGNVAEDYLQAIKTEQTKILVRLKRLLGHEKALARIRSAVRKARKDRAAQQTKESPEHIPRASTPTDMEIDVAPNALLTPPPTPAQETQRPERASLLVTKLGDSMTVLPPNREIAHEIQVNGTYEIQQQPWTESRKQHMDILRQGMRDSVQQGGVLAEAGWTRSMVILVKEKILTLVSQRHAFYDKITNFLDPNLIAQQARNKAFSYSDFFQTIASFLKAICSPGRDEIVKQFSEDTNSDTIDRLFTLMNILDLMILDHINFQFRLASRSVIEHGHEHEYLMFEKDIENGVHHLERTRTWWSGARAVVSSTSATTVSHANAIYARALVDLAFANAPLKFENFPETLRLDYVRLLKLRARVFKIVAIASILLTSKIRLRRNRESLWTKEAERLMKLDIMSIDVAKIVSLIESGHMMPDTTRAGLLDFVSRVLPSAVAAASKVKTVENERQIAIQERRDFDPASGSAEVETGDVFREQIATFILKSLREHIYTRLAASSTAEKVRTTSGASETLARVGMPEFVSDVGIIIDALERVKTVDLKAHEKWYDQVASEANQALTA